MKTHKINHYIATKLLGYKECIEEDVSPHNGDTFTHSVYKDKNGIPINEGLISGMLPSYNTSLKHSFNLLEALRISKSIDSYKIVSPMNRIDKSFDVYIKTETEFGRVLTGEASATSLPQAICLAIVDSHKAQKRHALRTRK